LVEHDVANVVVVGSNPITRSRIANTPGPRILVGEVGGPVCFTHGFRSSVSED
jgi:hypothetical protein